MAVEGRGEAIMDKVDWLGLILVWGLVVSAFVVSGLAFYEGVWVAGLFGGVGGAIMAHSSIDITKRLWRLKNEAQD